VKKKVTQWRAVLILTAVLSVLMLAGGACGRKPQAISSNPSASLEGTAGIAVRIDTGLVTGEIKDGVRIFKGLPYAAPPTGELRWKPPQPAKPWEGVRACNSFSPQCPQPKRSGFNDYDAPSSEDCLYLNIWTKADSPEAKLPVMVWIHGGGFTIGSSSTPAYNGFELAKLGVVLVSINYRLGPFGFMAHPALSKESPHGVSGNYGILDQIAALQWVKRNIGAFGGNAECVTIFGESAGACSVTALMTSPLAEGLFQRVIAESGFAAGFPDMKRSKDNIPSMESAGETLARDLGCDGKDDVLKVLRAKSAGEILEASNPAVGILTKGMKYRPCVDGWVLPENPVAVFNKGKQHHVPFLTGTNADEATIFLRKFPVKRPLGYTLFVKQLFKNNADEILSLYPAGNESEMKHSLELLVSDAAFVAPARFAVRSAVKSGAPAWLYHFTRIPPGLENKGLGCFHGLEIAYVFGNFRDKFGITKEDRDLARAMGLYWVTFASKGDPNHTGIPDWPAYDEKVDRYIEFGTAITIKECLHKEGCDLMEKILNERNSDIL